MPTILSQLDAAFRSAIKAALNVDADPMLGVSQNEKFGDYQSNAAMGLAKQAKANPRQVAEKIKASLDLGEVASEVSIAGPGFINVRLSPQFLAQELSVTRADHRVGVPAVASPQTVVIDYSGPNIAKEMHVGHLRSTIIGDAAARVLEFRGDKVIRQNHIGDWGTQFGKVILAIWTIANASRHSEHEWINRTAASLADAVKQNAQPRRAALIQEIGERHQRWLDEDKKGLEHFAPFLQTYRPSLDDLVPAYQLRNLVEAAPEATQFIIKGPYGDRPLSEQSKLITSFLQGGVRKNPLNQQELDAWKKVRIATMDAVQQIYDRLGVLLTHSDERGESEYSDDLPGVVENLEKLHLAETSEGATVVFIDGRDKPPLIIAKSGGEGFLYGTTDLAAIRYRVGKLHADRIIYFVDSRQAHHFAQVFATARKAGWAHDVSLEYAPFGTMLGEDGRPFKTRSGDTVKLKELLDEAEERALKVVTEKNPDLPESQRKDIARAVGVGGVKYADLSKDRISDYVFSWDKMLSMDGNTAPYLQYAYARIQSIFRKSKSGTGDSPVEGKIILESPFELALAKHILRFGEIVDLVGRELKPHHLTTYLYELATKFSSFYENCPVLQSEEPTRSSRLLLADATAKTLARGLDLLGIEHPEQM